MPDDTFARRIVYRVHGMDGVEVRRDLAFADGEESRMDLYAPFGAGKRRPGVVFMHGGPIARGSAPKDWGVFRSYGELMAASGFIGITFNHRYHVPADVSTAEADVRAAVDFVRTNADQLDVDRDRLALWAYSGGGPLISWVLREPSPHIRCIVSYYAVLDLQQVPGPLPPGVTSDVLRHYSPVAHLRDTTDKSRRFFVARAGRDNAWLNGTVDHFVGEAMDANLVLEVMTHPDGQHGFDILDSDDRSREIIARTIEVLRLSFGGKRGIRGRIRPLTRRFRNSQCGACNSGAQSVLCNADLAVLVSRGSISAVPFARRQLEVTDTDDRFQHGGQLLKAPVVGLESDRDHPRWPAGEFEPQEAGTRYGMPDPNVPTQLALVALDVDASLVRRFELALKQEVRSVAVSSLRTRIERHLEVLIPRRSRQTTYGNDNSMITAVTSGRVVRHVIACRRTRP